MRNRWVRCASNRNSVDDVKRYFNTFATKHPGYTFIIAKKFNDLYDVCVTAQQCSEIKRHLEMEFSLAGYLDEAMSLEVSWSNCTERSFRNDHEFREYREHTLSTMNRPVIKAKHAEARQHREKVENVFATARRRAFQIICFDIEVYVHDHDIMLEIGYVTCQFSPVTRYTSYSSQGDKPDVTLVTKRHLIIRENLHYKNDDGVPDNRDGFRFGSSETLSLADAVRR
jgi:hypothetical protein